MFKATFIAIIFFASLAFAGSVVHTKSGHVQWVNFASDKKSDTVEVYTKSSEVKTSELRGNLQQRFSWLASFSSVGVSNISYSFKSSDERTSEEVQKLLEAKLYADDSNYIKPRYEVTTESEFSDVVCAESGMVFINKRLECSANFIVKLKMENVD